MVTPEEARRPLWTRHFVLAVVINFFVSMVFYMLMTSMAGYALDRFSASETLAGLASSGFIIGAVIARLFGGKYLDLIGRKRLLLLSLLVYLLSCLAYLPTAELSLLIGIRLLHGIAFGAATTAIIAGVQSLIPSARRSEGTGYFGTSTTLSTALGPFLAVVLAERFTFDSVFLAAAGCSLIALLGVVLLRLPERPLGAEERAALRRSGTSGLIDPDGLRIGTIMGLAGAAYSLVLVFLLAAADQVGLAEAAPSFFFAFAVASLVSRLTIGRIQDTRGDNIVLYPLFVLLAAGMALLSWMPAGWAITAAGVLIGVGFGSLLPCTQAILVNRISAARIPVATSTFFLGLDVGTGIGPVVLGRLVPVVGYSGMYGIAVALVAAAAVVYHAVHGRHPGPA